MSEELQKWGVFLKNNYLNIAVVTAVFIIIYWGVESNLDWGITLLVYFVTIVAVFFARDMGEKLYRNNEDFTFAQWVYVGLVTFLMVGLTYTYGYEVPNISYEGGVDLYSRLDNYGFKMALHFFGAMAVIATAMKIMERAQGKKNSKGSYVAVGFISLAFVTLLSAGFFGSITKEVFQNKVWQIKTTEAISILKAEKPPYLSTSAIIAAEKVPAMAAIREGGREGSNERNALFKKASQAGNICKAFPAALPEFIAEINKIPEKEAGEDKTESVSGQSGFGPRATALALAIKDIKGKQSTSARNASVFVQDTALPTDASPDSAAILNKFASNCAILESEFRQRLKVLERNFRKGTFGGTYKASRLAAARGYFSNPIRLAKTALGEGANFPDLTLLVTEEPDSTETVAAKVELAAIEKVETFVNNNKANFDANVLELEKEQQAIDWKKSSVDVGESVRIFIEKAKARANAFSANEARELLVLVGSIASKKLQIDLTAAVEGYNTPKIEQPEEVTLFQAWFDDGSHGYFIFTLTMILTFSLETLVLWGSLIIGSRLGVLLRNKPDENEDSSVPTSFDPTLG